ncbi:DUF975 family protein [Paenibacillus sp. H1-7]|uniref:DUF975 family protein n=1 Tax=Paenibacillus sp. H1-7 TaxID=2282849 RepID=UPI001EF943EE|nr:DUF975 family protein [Paenibacillus sp. H1-7]ULL16955.1 DUF975 family protein [Paenibacillus sp. H1-7]
MVLSALREKARQTLQGRWMNFVGYTIVILILSAVIPNVFERIDPKDSAGLGTILSLLYSLLIVNAVTMGVYALYLRAARGQEVSLGMIFEYFSNGRYVKTILFYLLMGIYLFLWTLLLLIPGIIKSFSYALAPLVLIDDPQLTVNEAITRSRQMMDGYKWKLFCLYLSFIGWLLLSIVTLGIGLLWIIPYMQASLSHFYLELKEKQQPILPVE